MPKGVEEDIATTLSQEALERQMIANYFAFAQKANDDPDQCMAGMGKAAWLAYARAGRESSPFPTLPRFLSTVTRRTIMARVSTLICRFVGSATGRSSLCPALVLSAFTTLGCSGIDAGVEYPDNLPAVDDQVVTPEGDADPSITLGEFKIKADVCKDIDTNPVSQALTPDDLTRFFESRGVKITPKKARGNLYWFDFPNGKENNGFVRLRLAVMQDSAGAANDLHNSLMEHGPGWWGVRRSNLAVLAPKAGLSEALSFAIQNKLVCWGIFTYAGNDDAYVVAGPYGEL